MNAIDRLYELGDEAYSDVADFGLDRWTDKAVDYPDVPPWIEADITCGQVAAILQGGCASGAYMPAVTYHEAAATMAEHGDSILDFLSWHYDDTGLGLCLDNQTSWALLACKVVSAAVEAWALEVEAAIDDA